MWRMASLWMNYHELLIEMVIFRICQYVSLPLGNCQTLQIYRPRMGTEKERTADTCNPAQ
jgi:hypothetical protein